MLHPIKPVLKLTDALFRNPETEVVMLRSHTLEVQRVPLPVQVSVKSCEEIMEGPDKKMKQITHFAGMHSKENKALFRPFNADFLGCQLYRDRIFNLVKSSSPCSKVEWGYMDAK